MIREDPETQASAEQPQDGLLDRRNFLKYASALSMGAAATQALAPAARAQTAAPTFSDVAYARRVRPEAVEDPTEATLAEAATLIRDGRLSPVKLVEAQLDRIARFDGTYKAWNRVLAEEALARARTLAGRRPRTPLHGIPLATQAHPGRGLRAQSIGRRFRASPGVGNRESRCEDGPGAGAVRVSDRCDGARFARRSIATKGTRLTPYAMWGRVSNPPAP